MTTTAIRFERKPSFFGGSGTWESTRGYARLCGDTTARAVGIPQNVKVMYAVFSDKRSIEDFTITKRKGWGGPTYPSFGVDINYTFMLSARQLIGRMYRKGHRYVRIEY